ncbi:MAG: extracellular solute-binding protein, partial [Acidobacteria bacterium]|nr:extracellular solute-binding protein [Acidobacteriota bacterium]
MKRNEIPFTVPIFFALLLAGLLPLGGCQSRQATAELTIAVNAGVEGDALKAAAADYQERFGVRMHVVELPYANLFEKQLVDLVSATGAYDVIMLDDPWFPRYVEDDRLTPLEPMFEQRGLPGPDPDFLPACLAVCRHPYQSGQLFALPYVGNSQLFFYRRDLFDKYGLEA